MLAELLVIVAVAATAGLWAFLQLRGGTEPRVCSGAGSCEGGQRIAECAECPRRAPNRARSAPPGETERD